MFKPLRLFQRFQSTLPRWERLQKCIVRLACKKFQSTLPRGERRGSRWLSTLVTTVSIHAPARGATLSNNSCAVSAGFNPRSRAGSDERGDRGASLYECFNPRSRAGSDHTQPMQRRYHNGFNPRSRAGSDGRSQKLSKSIISFNPRSRAGSDHSRKPFDGCL